MHFLPIVECELRKAARQKITFRLRLGVILAFSLVTAINLFFIQFVGSSHNGRVLFYLLTYPIGLFCLAAGAFTTADSITGEVRDGTLGLLFLTDLKGYDVVLGKFIARSLSACYGVLGLVPLMAIPIFIGGVTGGELWRVSLAMFNALFFSLALGIVVSTFGSQSDRAVSHTVGLLLLLGMAAPLFGQGARAISLTQAGNILDSISPATPFLRAYGSLASIRPADFWQPLLTTHLASWVFLLSAALRLPHTWQEKAFRTEKRPTAAVARAWFRPNPEKSTQMRTRRLNQNPIFWLAGEASGMLWATWMTVGLIGVMSLFVGTLISPAISASLAGMVAVLLKILVAIQSTRYFVNARRSNELELLLCTPLTNREIIQGQWLALRAVFLWPMVMITATRIAMSIISWGSTFGTFGGSGSMFLFIPIGALFGVVTVLQPLFFVLDLVAITWMGMWLGLKLKKPQHAAGMNILFMVVGPMLIFCVPNLVIDVVVILIVRDRVYNELRPRPNRLALPLPLPPKSGPPPPSNPPPLPTTPPKLGPMRPPLSPT